MSGTDQQIAPAETSRPRLLRDPLLYGVAAFAVALCGPIFRYLGWLGDEGIILHGAVRLLGGETIYRDFFELWPPGAFVIVAAWMKVFGEGFGSVRVLAVGLIATIAALLYAAARLASGHRVLPAVLALAWAIRAPFEISHHWFTTVASMAAALGVFLTIEGGSTRRGGAFAAGLFAGAALMFTQTRGALVCAAVLVVLLTLPGARARLLSAIAGMALCPTAALTYLASTGSLADAANDLVLFPARHYLGVQALAFASFATWADTVTVALFPSAVVLSAVAVAVPPHGALWRDPRGRMALALGVAGFFGAVHRPDIAHLNFTAPLVCPLVAVAATYLLGRLPRPAGIAAGALVIGVCLVAVGYGTVRRIDAITGPLETLPTRRGPVVRRPGPWVAELAALMAQLERLPAGERVFFYPYLAMLPYLTELHHVGAFDLMLPGLTTPEQFSDTCVRVVRDARWMVIDRSWSDPRKLRQVLPAMQDYDPPEKRAFEHAVAQAFGTVVHTSPVYQLRRRSDAVAGGLCQQAPGTR